MPAKIKSQTGFFVRKLLAQSPARHIGVLHNQRNIRFVVPEQAVLIRRTRLLIGTRQSRIHAGHQTGAMIVKAVERARAYQCFNRAPVDDALVHAPAKIEHVFERALLARLDDAGNGRFAGTFDGTQSVSNGSLVHRGKHITGAVHIGWQHANILLQRINVEGAHFVGIVQIARQRRRHECRRMMRLEIGRLIGHQRVGGSVRFIETIAGKFFHQIEQVASLLFRGAVPERAVDKNLALLGHLFRILLAHRTAQQVGCSQAITANHLRHLHHLLLVHHDAVGFTQDRLDRRVWILEFLAVLAPHEIRDQIHRAGPIERHQRNNVFKTIRPGTLQHVLHAARFQLENGGGIACLQQLVSRRIIQRQGFQGKRCRSG